jgi:hypothetical protein
VNRCSSAYVIGRVVGSYVIPAICVLLYYKIRAKNPASPAKFLVISCVTVLWAFLLHFALAHRNDYSLQNGQVVFTRKNEGAEFDRKQEIAKLSHLEFLHAYGRFMTAQNASFTQLGLPPLDLGGRPPTASSVTDFLSQAAQGGDPKSAH